MLYTNAYCTNTTWGDEFKGWHVLFDGNDGTFFHSEYANVESSDALDHYLRVDLGAGNEIEKFSFTYRTRKNYSINSPTKIVVEGSNIADGLYTEIAVLTGLPTNNSTYESDMLSNGNRYRFIRFRVTETSSNQKVYNHPFFYISEFGMTRYVDVMSIPKIMPAEDVTIEGSFAVNYYAVTYKVDGEVYATDSIAYGNEIVLREHPTKEGHTFSGWSEAQVTMPASDITIEGTFTVNSYNVIYKVDGEEYQIVPVTYGSEITLIEAPTKEGCTFCGWSEAPATMPANDVTIEGTFVVKYYTITYMVNGTVFATDSVAYGSVITLIDVPVKEGYTFSGWSEAPVTMPAEDIVIEGSFPVNYNTMTYIVDGEVFSTETVAYGSEILFLDGPEKPGYKFVGWAREVPQAIDIAGDADNMLYSNAYCTTGGDKFVGWHVLFDDNTGTFFHSEYASNKPSSDGLHHYLRIDLGEGNEVETFSFTYSNRQNISSGSPTIMLVEGSNVAGGEYEEIAVLTGMPTYNSTYTSDIIGNGNKYRFIRLRVIETYSNNSPSGHPFFYISEFGMKNATPPKVASFEDMVLTAVYMKNDYVFEVDGLYYKVTDYVNNIVEVTHNNGNLAPDGSQ
jgi:hypothetical protein